MIIPTGLFGLCVALFCVMLTAILALSIGFIIVVKLFKFFGIE